MPRIVKFVASPEVGTLSILAFAMLYTWPFLTLDRPGSVFKFVFVVWFLHVALLAARAYACKELERSETEREET